MDIEKLKGGARVAGTMLRLVRNPAVARLAAQAGLDFVMADMEHGPYSFESLSDLFAVARAAGLVGMVRVPELSRSAVSRILDCGAQGIMVPMVESVEQAQALAAWAKFAPLGQRGLGSAGGHTDYASVGARVPAFMERANRETLTIAQIETAAGVEQAARIAAVEGLDALLIGPNDLAVSLGRPGDTLGGEVGKAIERVAAAARSRGKVLGMHGSEELLARWIPQGVTLVMSSLDINMLLSAMEAVATRYRTGGAR